MTKQQKILVVADNLAAFRQCNPCLTNFRPDWDIEYSQSRADALFCIRRTEYDLVFVDLDAGTMTGSELIHELRLRQPNAIYFLLGAAADPDLLVACAKGVHQFLQKPLDPETLDLALERADLVQSLLMDGDIQKLVANIRIFPSRPETYLRVIRELRSADASAASVGELVEKDLGIATKLLQVANSAYFGLQQKVSAPAEAVLHLGLETTASLVLALEIFSQFDHHQPNYFAIDHVWKHCQGVAETARALAEAHCPSRQVARDAFTGGLLHDIGKLALSINIKEEYGGVLRLARQRGVPVWRAEWDTLGTTHAAVGAYLLALWGMPMAVVRAVAAHHDTTASLPGEFDAATAVHLANTLEYLRPPLKRAFPGLQLDLDYPASLGLEAYFAEETAGAPADSAGIMAA